jgi:hypothetical protein
LNLPQQGLEEITTPKNATKTLDGNKMAAIILD